MQDASIYAADKPCPCALYAMAVGLPFRRESPSWCSCWRASFTQLVLRGAGVGDRASRALLRMACAAFRRRTRIGASQFLWRCRESACWPFTDFLLVYLTLSPRSGMVEFNMGSVCNKTRTRTSRNCMGLRLVYYSVRGKLCGTPISARRKYPGDIPAMIWVYVHR